jgi:hypothetical protein
MISFREKKTSKVCQYRSYIIKKAKCKNNDPNEQMFDDSPELEGQKKTYYR